MSGFARIAEVCAIAMGALGVYLMVALLTFNPSDPSWSQTAVEQSIANAAGSSGAWFADLLLFSFGFMAYSVPLISGFLAWALFWRPCPVAQLNFFTLGLRVIGFVFTFASLTTLASIHIDDFFFFSSGGLVGDIFTQLMIPVFGLLGTSIILLAVFAGGVTLFTGVSWIQFVEQLGSLLNAAYSGLVSLPERMRNKKQRELEQDVLMRDFEPEAKAEESTELPEPNMESDIHLQTDFVDEQQPSLQEKLDAEPVVGSQVIEPSFSIDSSFEEELSQAKEDIEFAFEDESVDPPSVILDQTPPEPMPDIPFEGGSMPAKAKTVAPSQPQTPAAAAQPRLSRLPDMNLLDRPDKKQNPISQEELEQVSRLVEAKLLDFNIQASVVAVHPGPVITRFELDLAPGVKVSKITNLSKDLARALSAISVRVVEVIPGKSVIGLELPNRFREIVYLSEVVDSPVFHQAKSPLTMVLGKDIAGQPVVVDLAKMPHLLVAGTTGSGKSVGVNVMIVSLLYKSTPEDVRLIMIDPKMLELSVYEGIPHLLSEVVTDMKEAANALRWCVGEMERRYKLMSALGVRNLKGYNQKVLDAMASGNPIVDPLWKPEDSMAEIAPTLEKLPHIVVVIDEFADMMMIVGKKVEELIARIAQKARAAGIHLVLATQRPSVDVITGLIKANIPTRMAFQVSSRIDSRTILDQQGAETLLGMGDMLYLPAGTGVPTRVHGAFVDDHEVHAVVSAWKERGEPDYIDEILNGEAGPDAMLPGEVAESDEELDALFDQAVMHVTETRRGSVSGVQRKFKIGYNRAARIVEQMEVQGIVSAPGHNGNREVIAPPPVRID
ncbi:DNA translocase FtsK 4TM domain-containing protein [Agarivorans sp. 2_MG-2023]|uniref:DNA translocase FtsK n=2 Tax=unclassified Agarivorans TaxID=2636026 RepID=UPI0026E243F6|nr:MULTISPECIES: DNA translocase FtsK [unclassified Agarivorans]MDO6684985.1 DNA translocase FtsK 4TM domain-containing protein [Agarivorans sp. 3_MG-2023]MDO6714854.1 DNA translocase FtsK 4TM domain-containing protein [Agarivorans sp. 2_MG-2023]